MNRRAWILAGMMGVLAGATACTEATPDDSEPEEEVGEAADALLNQRFGWATLTFDGIDLTRTYSSTGGAVTRTNGVGIRTVTFEGFPYHPETNVQVVSNYAFGGRVCTLAGPPTGNSTATHVNVSCWVGYVNYASQDGTTEVIVAIESEPGATFAPSRGAFLTTAGGTSPTVTSSWNSSGGTNTVTWNAASQWFEVSLPGLGFENAGVQVTAMSPTNRRCKTVSWGSGIVRVRCFQEDVSTFQHDLLPTSDSGFSLSYNETSQIPGKVGGHAWVSNGSVSPSYASALSATGPCGTAPTFSVYPAGSAPDLYTRVYLPDSAFAAPTQVNVPMVTSYGSSSDFCEINTWARDGNGTNVFVGCVGPDGTTHRPFGQSQFTISLSSRAGFKACP